MLKRLPGIVLFVAVALLTQVGGLALALGWLVSRWLLPERMDRWQRTGFGFLLFAGSDGLLHVVAVPPLAALGGRVPLLAPPNRTGLLLRSIRCFAGSTGTTSTPGLSP